MRKNKLIIHSKGRSHLYDIAVMLKSLGYRIKFVTFWPSFKFPKLKHVKSYYIPYILVKLLVGENLFYKFFRLLNRSNENIIIDINLIGCYSPSSNLILDMPTNFPYYQDEQWEIEETHTGIKIERRKRTKERLLDNNLLEYINKSKLILVLNEASKNTVPKKFRNKVIVLPPLEVTEIPESVIKNKKIVKNILCVGIFCPSKGYHYMIEGLNALNREYNIHFFGNVNDSYVEYIKGICHHNLHLNFYGHIKQEKLFRIMKNYDVMIFPSVSEGFPLSAIQALSKGIPIFASKNSNLEEILPNECLYETRSVSNFIEKFSLFEKQAEFVLNLKNIGLQSIEQQWKDLKKHL